MNLEKILSPKAGGLAGILVPIIALSCIFTAILLCPWFSWTDNYLSDLGGSPNSDSLYATHGLASILFNFGLINAGILGIFFALVIFKVDILNSRLGRIGNLFYLLGAIALTGVGLFSETTEEVHILFTLLFFMFIGTALSIIGITLIRSNEKKLGWYTFTLSLFCMLSIPLFMTPQPIGDNAVAEIIPVLSIAMFSAVFGLRIFRSKQDY